GSIILVYPLWWGTIPMPVATFLENNDFSGKTIYLLATQGSTGFGSTVEDVTELVKGAKVVKGLSIYCDDIPYVRDELEEWMKSIK
ncbi:MAG: flavodoxin, partial [Lachnospiraceae bacterium]|nr:flavodoxin [Lachnospiraceae bacterium]